MRKKALWKDIKKCFSKSKGRFFSIMCLIALGSFALVGLQVTGPDMRRTGADYFEKLNVADITIIGDYGIDEENEKAIAQASGTETIEYGYLKDVTIKNTQTSIRVFSSTDTLSQYELVKGNMPEKKNEIAIASFLSEDYKLGEKITLDEKEDAAGDKVLKKHTFKIVGFVNSGEILSAINMGNSTAGTGELKGYAVVTPKAFDSDVYMIARLSFKDTEGKDPYSDTYTDLIQAHKDELDELLEGQPELRLASVKSEYQEEVDDGQKEVDDAKKELSDAKKELKDGRTELDDASEQVDESQQKLDDSVAAAQDKIDSGASQISDGKTKISENEQKLKNASAALKEGSGKLNSSKKKVSKKKKEIESAEVKISASEETLSEKSKQLEQSQEEYDEKAQQLSEAKEQISEAKEQISSAVAELAQKKEVLSSAKSQYESGISGLKEQITKLEAQQGQAEEQQETGDGEQTEEQKEQDKAQQGSENGEQAEEQQGQAEAQQESGDEEQARAQKEQIAALKSRLSSMQDEYDKFMDETYDPGMKKIQTGEKQIKEKQSQLEEKESQAKEAETALAKAKKQLESGKKQLSQAQVKLKSSKKQVSDGKSQILAAESKLKASEKTLNQKEVEYEAGVSSLASAKATLKQKEKELDAAKEKLEKAKTEGEEKIAEAKKEIEEKEKEYQEALSEYKEKKPDAEADIAEAEEKLEDARETIDSLELPVYALDTRREIPGAEGYKIYGSVSDIVDELANVFPIFLYFVAALVTLTTMTRFVDEERINSGTLKALGYSDRDILKKFTVYGWTASFIGAVTGIIAGHILIPLIVYNAYGHNFTYPKIELHFYPGITILALVLALASAVIPAYIAAIRELREKPAALLQPKPPAAGSRIFLERIKPLWNRMSFTHKVTARNIFRYKKRMLMTVFGVCGAVSLLFAGFSVQHSISGVNDRQFGEIIRYDLIVAQENNLDDGQQKELNSLLSSDDVKRYMPVVYEKLTKTAGENKDKQEIKLIVPESEKDFSKFISLTDRKSGGSIDFKDNGAVISERLAKLLDAKAGDTVAFLDEDNNEYKITVSGITEMYTGHFMFMNQTYYKKIFEKDYTPNANLVTLNDNSEDNANEKASEFIKLDSVSGVVQNTTMKNQISTIVKSLNKIMQVLIIVAMLLAVVILYNLTNINVSERIRELSTIKVLGFYDKEVTMYIYRETILLTLLGIFAGFGLGDALYRYILAVVPPDEVMFNPALGAKAFLVPFIAVSLITVVLGFVINRRLKNVDMLEALKSVD